MVFAFIVNIVISGITHPVSRAFPVMVSMRVHIVLVTAGTFVTYRENCEVVSVKMN